MSANITMSNDFGNWGFSSCVYGRGAVEEKFSIKIADVTNTDVWRQHNDPELDILPQKFRRFRIRGIEMELIKDPRFYDWYIELLNPGPNCYSSAISFKKSKCRYGGYRYWFQCPNDSCQRRVGVLYKNGDSFECRKCLDLDYLSHKINYKSIEPAIRYLFKVENRDLNFLHKYKGKDTKKMKQFYKLEAKAKVGLALFGKKYGI